MLEVFETAGIDSYDLMAVMSEEDVEDIGKLMDDEYLDHMTEEELLEELDAGFLEDVVIDL